MTIAPFEREFVSLRDVLDRLVEDSLVAPRTLFQTRIGDGSSVSIAADLYEMGDAYVLKTSVPGFKPEDINVTATADTVTVKGEFKTETKVKDASYLRQERRLGSFERSFTLPLPIEPDKVEADQSHGVLTVTMPKSEKTKAKHIEIKPREAA